MKNLEALYIQSFIKKSQKEFLVAGRAHLDIDKNDKLFLKKDNGLIVEFKIKKMECYRKNVDMVPAMHGVDILLEAYDDVELKSGQTLFKINDDTRG